MNFCGLFWFDELNGLFPVNPAQQKAPYLQTIIILYFFVTLIFNSKCVIWFFFLFLENKTEYPFGL